jgi:hypothetical protein
MQQGLIYVDVLQVPFAFSSNVMAFYITTNPTITIWHSNTLH